MFIVFVIFGIKPIDEWSRDEPRAHSFLRITDRTNYDSVQSIRNTNYRG